jgi:hypothetical protein
VPLALRYLGMAVSWAGFALSFTVLFLSMRAVLAVGGFCAEGGPYVIETHCPGDTGWLTPLSVFLGLASVAIGVLVARGFGASLMLLAWPILFIGLSINFLQAGFPGGGQVDLTGVLLSAMFLLMGAVPLVLWLRRPGNAVAAVAGTSRIDGVTAGSVSLEFRAGADSSDLGLRPIDYLVLIPLWLVEAAIGVWLGVLWFTS